MQYYQNQVCISYRELIEPGILSIPNFKQYVYRNKIEVLQKGGNGREALIAYDTMPEELKAKIREVYGDDIKDRALQSPLLKYYEQDVNAIDFFATYKLPNGKFLPEGKQREYSANAAALNAVIKLMEANRTMRKSMGGKAAIGTIYKDFILPSLQAFRTQWAHKLPKSERQLRDVIKRYQDEGYQALISGKLANENAAKIVETEQHALLRRLLSHANNFDYAQVMMMYNEVAAVQNWRKVTRKTVENFANKNKLFTEGGRRGEVSFDNKIAMQVKRRQATYPMLMWSVDGWDAELLYQKTETNKNGHSVTTYHHRPNVVIVLDPYTKYPVGYAIGTHETPDLIKTAIRNAMNHTAELFGCRHRPRQIQSDRFGGTELKNFYEAAAGIYIPARARNAKAKPVEPYFKDLNKNRCQYYNNWSGFGVTAQVDNQPNNEYKNKIRHSFPDFAGVVSQLEEIIAQERADKREAYLEGWASLPEYYKLPWSSEQYLLNLGIRKPRTNRLRGEGLAIEIARNEYVYDSFDLQFRANMHTDWTVCYDPEDMGSVLAINEDASLRFLLQEKHRQALTLTERTEQDSLELAKINQFNKEIKGVVMQQQAQDYEVLEDVFQRNSGAETLAKMLMIDSLGQHKSQRSRAINEATKKLAAPDAQPEDNKTSYAEYLDSKVDLNDYL